MKKIFFACLMCICSISAMAQELKTVDVKANLRSELGVGAGVTVGLIDNIDIAPSLNYYFDGDYFSIDADFHYNIDLGSSFTLFPLAGPVYFHASDFNKIGLNMGCGISYNLTPSLDVFGEAKYQVVSHHDDCFFSGGVKIRF